MTAFVSELQSWIDMSNDALLAGLLARAGRALAALSSAHGSSGENAADIMMALRDPYAAEILEELLLEARCDSPVLVENLRDLVLPLVYRYPIGDNLL